MQQFSAWLFQLPQKNFLIHLEMSRETYMLCSAHLIVCSLSPEFENKTKQNKPQLNNNKKNNQQIPHIYVSFHTQQQCCWKTAAGYFDFQLKQSLKKWSAV